MSVAYFIVLERDIEGFDPFVNGKALGHANEKALEKLCAKLNVTPLAAFLSQDPEMLEDFLEEEDVDVPDDLPHIKNDVGRSNERWIESRRAWTGADALAEFVATTDARIAGLRDLDDEGFAADSWTPMGPGTVASLLGFRLFDSWVHEQDMRVALERPGDLDSDAARFSIEVRRLPRWQWAALVLPIAAALGYSLWLVLR